MIVFFFFNDTATTEIYTLSLHDALPIWMARERSCGWFLFAGLGTTGARQGNLADHLRYTTRQGAVADERRTTAGGRLFERSEEHTSELQSRQYLVCRLLLEKKKNKILSK